MDYTVTIDALPTLSFGRKVAIVTNPKVAGLHLAYVMARIQAKELYVITVPDGESYKTLSTIETILENCFEHRLDRKSLLIGLGGGVIGDMTGFAASLFQRGIDFVQIPTTLLAQVDASVGGKTGINNRFGKNLIGAFHQPKAVYIDPSFLTTLPAREYQAGIAEIIKMAVTFDSAFFAWLEKANLRDKSDIAYAIEQSVRIKARVVAMDEKEQGIRAALNYGHTFGHVIEHEAGYGHYLHGEAVAIGMVMANALAVRLGLMQAQEAARVEKLLKHYDLPTHFAIADVEHFYDLFFMDKKSANDAITFILPKGIGDVALRNDIPKVDVVAVLAAQGA
ncbi:MAG: 3-dehydroquinate synthase [Sulfuricurvum sp. PC08-66]|nr:MAG: 3-dehydroquinate synthase [Sulfuricurvum sp. PC08-66]